MNIVEFENGIKKLIAVYGDRAYPAERQTVLYKEFQSQDPYHWDEVVDYMIKERYNAPPAKLFLEQLAKIRERDWGRKKEAQRNAAESFFDDKHNPLQDKEVQKRMKVIKERMFGKISDEKWKGFLNYLNKQVVDE